MLSEKEVKKVKKIQEMIKSRLKDHDQETVYISYREFEREALTKNRDGLLKILELIETKTEKKITTRAVYKWEPGMRTGPSSVLDYEFRVPAKLPDTGIKIHITDPVEIDDYFKLVLKKPLDKGSSLFDDHLDEIKLTIGIRIKGEYAYKKDGVKKKVFNRTEKNLVYLLHSSFLENENACLKFPVLISELKRSKSYIKNSIGSANKNIKQLVIKKETNLPDLIKREDAKDGYRLNPVLMRESQN